MSCFDLFPLLIGCSDLFLQPTSARTVISMGVWTILPVLVGPSTASLVPLSVFWFCQFVVFCLCAVVILSDLS